MYCTQCGHQVDASAKFCSSCGTPTLVEDHGNPELEGIEQLREKALSCPVCGKATSTSDIWCSGRCRTQAKRAKQDRVHREMIAECQTVLFQVENSGRDPSDVARVLAKYSGTRTGAPASSSERPPAVQLSEEERERLKTKHAKQTRVVLVLGGVFVALALLNGAWTSHVQKRQQIAAAEEAKRVAEEARLERQAKDDALREAFPGAQKSVTTAFTSFDAAATGDDFVKAREIASAARETLRPYRKLDEPPEGIPDLVVALEVREKVLEAQSELDNADAAREAGQWVKSDDGYSKALASIAELTESYKEPGVLRSLQRRAERGQRAVAGKARKQRDEDAKAAALLATCGKKPERSGWDGEIIGIESDVKRTAHDPGSIDVENCTVPVLTELCWRTVCQVRGKNAFGASVLNEMTFYVANRNGIAQVLSAE